MLKNKYESDRLSIEEGMTSPHNLLQQPTFYFTAIKSAIFYIYKVIVYMHACEYKNKNTSFSDKVITHQLSIIYNNNNDNCNIYF